MDQSNKLKLTWISFFSYGLTGALVIITGVILNNVADYFKLPISSMSNTFTFLNSGILVSIFLNAWLIDIFSFKKQLIFGFLLINLAILGLINSYSIVIFSLSIFIIGIVSGITMSIGTCLITYLYTGKKRGILLLFTDSFFSISGTIFPLLFSVLITHNITWYWIYVCIGLVYLIIFILTLISNFPIIKPENNFNNLKLLMSKKENCEISIFLLSLAALCYILGQLGFISWIPEYVFLCFHINVQQSSKLVSSFWISYMIGMWFFGILLRFLDLQKTITTLTALSSIFMYLFIHTNDISLLYWYLLALGFVSSAIYSSIITLGSQQTKVASHKLVNFILTSGTVGTMLTFIVTSPIVNHYGVFTTLKISNFLYIIVFFICFVLGLVNKNKYY